MVTMKVGGDRNLQECIEQDIRWEKYASGDWRVVFSDSDEKEDIVE